MEQYHAKIDKRLDRMQDDQSYRYATDIQELRELKESIDTSKKMKNGELKAFSTRFSKKNNMTKLASATKKWFAMMKIKIERQANYYYYLIYIIIKY